MSLRGQQTTSSLAQLYRSCTELPSVDPIFPPRGGFARLATLIAKRKEARQAQGPVLILDGGDYSMGTAFGAAIRETGGELQLLSRMGYDATTFGNHEFDLGPDGTAQANLIDIKTKFDLRV